MIDYLTSLFNKHWDRSAIADMAAHDQQLRVFFDTRIFPLLDACWHFVMYKGNPCVYEKQSLSLTLPYATPRVVKEAEFKKQHRELHLLISMLAFKKKAVKHLLFDIWSVCARMLCAGAAPALHKAHTHSVHALCACRVHHRARTEVRLAFNPTGDIGELRQQAGVDAADIASGIIVVNTFVGLPIDGLMAAAAPSEQALENDPLYWHLKHVICAGNIDSARYLCRWLAFILQRRTKSEIVPVLIGGHGTGKSMIVKKIAQMFGSHFYPMQNPQVRHCTGGLNLGGFRQEWKNLIALHKSHTICARSLSLW